MSIGPFREGLCGNKSDHEPHTHYSESLGLFHCHANQKKRLPYVAEVRRKSNG